MTAQVQHVIVIIILTIVVLIVVRHALHLYKHRNEPSCGDCHNCPFAKNSTCKDRTTDCRVQKK